MLRLKTVYSTPVCYEYRASVFSCANFWRFFSHPIIVIIALFLTFATQDEKGRIQQFWSPVTTWNELWSEYLTFPSFETNAITVEGDDRPEEITINIHLRSKQNNLASIDKLRVITFVLFFDVLLERRVLLQLQMCPVIGRINKPSDSYNSLSIIGIFELKQYELLPSWGNLTISPFEWAEDALEYVDMTNNSTTNNSKITTRQLGGIDNALKTKMDSAFWALQNFQVEQIIIAELERSAHHWHYDQSNETDPNTFFINYRLKINEQIFVYKTSTWEMLKLAWIQFLAIYIIIRSLFNSLSAFIYKNQILETVILRPHNDDWTCKLN